MKLVDYRVTNFRSVEDSGPIQAGELTCLVGKNEAGKTAILHALAGLNPHPSSPIRYDIERDFPRRHLNTYQKETKEKEAIVVVTSWSLTEKERAELDARLGKDFFLDAPLQATRRYGAATFEWEPPMNYRAIIDNLFDRHGMAPVERAAVSRATTTSELMKELEAVETPSEAQSALMKEVAGWPGKNATGLVREFLNARIPSFMYFSHYDRMAGQIRLDDIQESGTRFYRHPNGPVDLDASERVFLEFLTFAGTALSEIKASATYESLNAKCESASNSITEQLQEFWTQNPFLEVEIRVTKAEPGDAPPFNAGVIARARVKNTLHRVTVPFSERSAGFVWFFSFLVKFSQLHGTGRDVILLLDEPGLTLHGKAQADLLRFFDDRIVPNHQIIFSTHSPFMVPADDLSRCRIVEDEVVEERPRRFVARGTKVRDDVLATDPDTVFPLQGALGYDVTQSLFIGKHTLLVEGPGDILFLRALSAQLKRRKRESLDPRWVICPSGGIDKIQSFVALFVGAKLNLAVMTDLAPADRRKLESLKQRGILPEARIMNFADTLGLAEADAEDMFHPDLYLRMVNEGFDLKQAHRITTAKLDSAATGIGRLLKRVEAAFKLLPPSVREFDHFTPADWLIRNPGALDGIEQEVDITLDNAEKVIRAINLQVN